MKFNEVMSALEAAGSEQTRKTYRRHGAKDPMFGVSFAVLGQLKKKIKTDHALARELWATGNVDARNLATMIADPLAMSSAEMDRWVTGLEGGAFSGLLARNVVVHSRRARDKALQWTRSRRELVAESGWLIVAAGAGETGLFQDEELIALIPKIEAGIHSSPNLVRAAMNNALIAIGIRNAKCRAPAMAAAKRIGKVHVDHGYTACQTPDAVAYIAKAVAYRAAQKARRRP